MHRAALNGLNMVGHKLLAKGEEAYHHKEVHKTWKCTKHIAITTVLGVEAASNDLDRHHQNSTVELEDHDPQKKNTTMKMTKKRWGHRALPEGFIPLQFPRYSGYLMINKSTTGHRNHNHDYQIIYKQCKY
jgi:hypothetical protein